MKELAQLQEKLRELLNRYQELSQKTSALEQKLGAKETELEGLAQENKLLKETLGKEQMQGHLSRLPEAEKNNLRTNLDAVLAMIESNIKLLK